MKRLLLLLSVIALGGASVQKPTHITVLDKYGGVPNVSCTNPNGTSYFGLTTVASHKVLCDPLGHPYFGRGFFVFDFSQTNTDENGGSYNSYVRTKYGASNYQYTWDTAEVARLNAWGYNMIGPVSTTYALAPQPWVGGGTNPNKVPYMIATEPCSNSWTNRNSWGTAPVKDVLSTSSPNWNGNGYYGYSGVTDYDDPAWVSYVQGDISSSGDSNIALVLAANATDKSYLVGIAGCDSDYTHGFDTGPDYATTPVTGNNDFRLSYELALGSPVEWASTHQSQIYTDSTVYGKKALYTQLTVEYSSSISALNTAWGSSYTTFGTSGTCLGSHFAAWICPSPSAATSVGTGNGSTLTFSTTLSTTVSANSLGIFVAGTLVGGDGGNGHFSGTAGTIYGPHLSGTINYATGALSITFASGNAPANAAAITAEYITNGWGSGTGVMDEDGRSAHQSWTGTNSVCIDGVGDSTACNTGGGSMYASAGMATDLNTLDKALATQYASTFKSTITAQLPGALFLGGDTASTWGVPPNRYVLQGMASYADVLVLATGGSGLSQSKLDFVHTYAGDMALGVGLYNVANQDSPFAWVGSSCSHSSTTVTCTVATPQNLSTSWAIDASCTDTTYNVTDIGLNSSSGSTVVYTAGSTPSTGSTTCNVFFSNSDNFSYTTQLARSTAAANLVQALPSASYTADGIYPFVMALWWQFSDNEAERLDWGIVDLRDNAFDGTETQTATLSCLAPLQAYSCGGELRSGWGTTDGITPLKTANMAIDTALAGL